MLLKFCRVRLKKININIGSKYQLMTTPKIYNTRKSRRIPTKIGCKSIWHCLKHNANMAIMLIVIIIRVKQQEYSVINFQAQAMTL